MRGNEYLVIISFTSTGVSIGHCRCFKYSSPSSREIFIHTCLVFSHESASINANRTCYPSSVLKRILRELSVTTSSKIVNKVDISNDVDHKGSFKPD